MKHAKRMLVVLLMALLCAVLVMVADAEGATIVDSGYCGAEGDGTNLSWTLDSEGTLTISGTGRMSDYEFNNRPWENYYNQILQVQVQKGVTNIGNFAFRSLYISNAVVSDGVITIGEFAFENNPYLTSVTLPDSAESIEKMAYNTCKHLVYFTVPANLKSIDIYAFGACCRLTSFILPTGVTSISDGVFSSTGLTSFIVPNSVTTIGNGAFQGSTDLESVIIPDSVTIIGDYAFQDCTSLTSIEIPSYVEGIGRMVFGDCESLTSVSLPAGITSIGDFAFNHTDLKYVYFAGNETMWSAVEIGDYNEPLVKAEIHFNPNPVHVHTYTASLTASPNCSTTGVRTYSCECGSSYTEVLPVEPNAHVMKTIVVDPSCIGEGYTMHECTLCRYSYNDTFVAALGHDTLDENGNCLRCGKKVQDVEQPTEPTVNSMEEKPEKNLNFFQRIIQWFKNLFAKLFGR